MVDDKRTDEQGYTDPETGKPIIYADNVPELLRGDLTLTPEEEARIPDLDALYQEAPLKLAEQGVESWNLWVKAHSGRWVARDLKGDAMYVYMTDPGSELRAEGTYINFSRGAGGHPSRIKPQVTVAFSGFVFPATIHFCNLTLWGNRNVQPVIGDEIFVRATAFEGCHFCSAVRFIECDFRDPVEFRNCKVADAFVLKSSQFHQGLSILGGQYSGESQLRHLEINGVLCVIQNVFQSDVSISQVEVGANLYMESNLFRSNVYFSSAMFRRSSKFSGSQFLGSTQFEATVFDGYASFDNVTFGYSGNSTFDVQRSQTVPDFKGAKFLAPPNLGYTHVQLPTVQHGKWWRLFSSLSTIFSSNSWTADAAAASKLRRLQELASEGHHNLAEKRFFRAELLCRRGHEATGRETLMINLFELFSMCGLSFRRPVMWWLGLFAVFFAVYGGFAGLFEAGWSVEDSFHLINYTFSNATPVLGVIKASDSAAVQALFNGGQPPWVTLLAGVHNLISTIFLFFALLAIRNYFKLG